MVVLFVYGESDVWNENILHIEFRQKRILKNYMNMCDLQMFGQFFKIRFCQNSIRRNSSLQKSDSSFKKKH